MRKITQLDIKHNIDKHIYNNIKNNRYKYNHQLSNQKFKERGVTIMSLVITIIVLLILAGITIKLALDDNGIIKQSKLASEKYQNKALQEQFALNQAEQEIDKVSNSSSSSGSSGGGNQSTGGNSTGGGSGSGSSENTDELKKQIEDLQNEVDSLTAQIQQEKQEKEQLQQQVNDLKKQQNETNSTISDLNNQIKDKDNKITDLTKEKESLESQINTLKSKQATGNATASQVLAGATFSTSAGVGLTGTMVNRKIKPDDVAGMNSSYASVPTWNGTWLQYTQATDGTNRISICPPEGYYPGNGQAYVGAEASEFGDATAADVTSGKTFTSKDGLKITGNGSAQSNSYNSGYNAGYSNGQSASRPNVSNFKTAAIGMDQYGAHSGTVSFPSNGYVFITGAIINKRQTYGGRTAILHVQLSGSEVASAGSTSNSGVEDGVGLGNFNTSWLSYTANSAIYAYVDGSIQRMSAMVRIGFVPAS